MPARQKKGEWHNISALLFEDSDKNARGPDNVKVEDNTSVLFSLGHLC
jgi:hypothetical protein